MGEMKNNLVNKIYKQQDIEEMILNTRKQIESNKINELLEEIEKECELKSYIKRKIYEKIFDYIESENNDLQENIEKAFKCGIEKTIEIIFFSKENVRDNFINLLEKDEITNKEKQQLLEIIFNMKKITSIQKERFILYYGLDFKKEKIHNYAKIARLDRKSVV